MALCLIASLIAISSLVLYFNRKKTILKIDHDYVTLTYYYDGKASTVRGQMMQTDYKIHIFAPPFYKLDNIIIDAKDKYTITEGYYYGDRFSKEIVNENQVSPAILISDNKDNDIIIHQLENDILSIDLKDGYTLDDIKADKELKVKANIQNIDKYGKTLFNGKLEHIKGRGNVSWYKEKRGYILSFSTMVNLEGIKGTEKYVLIPSYYDMTGMRNKIVYDFANDLELSFSPNAKYVNVFINENYEGLYLLSQSVSVSNESKRKETNSVINTAITNIGKLREIKYFNNDLPSKTKRYLIEREIDERYEENNKDAGFITEKGNHYIIHNSNTMTYEEIKELALKVQELEESLYIKNDTKYLDLIDLDSWAKQYIVELVSQNHDAYKTSSFFYYDTSNGKFYGGPVWDYDGSIADGYISTQDYKDMKLTNNILSSKYDFMKRVVELFNNSVAPNIDMFVNKRISLLSKTIKNDMYLNALRYNQTFSITSDLRHSEYNYDAEIEHVREHLCQRVSYLENILNSDSIYHKVIFNTNNDRCGSLLYLVKDKDLIITDHKVPYYSSGDGFVWNKPLWVSKWVDKDGKEFDFTKPITQDIELYAVWEGDVDADIIQK